jgi:hypothetical protein
MGNALITYALSFRRVVTKTREIRFQLGWRARVLRSGALAVLLALAAPAVRASDFVWPLSLDPILTASFGEYRTGHVHAGFDLGTNQATGIPVVAVADGYLSRIRTSPFGYGKAIYLTFADGRTAVYAHLDEFAPRFRDYVRLLQQVAGRYTIDQTPGKGSFPIRRGEPLGTSGDTGTDAPHLHFELRGADNCPINPTLNGFAIRDSRPPVPLRVRLVPRDPEALVAGWHRERDVRFTAGGDGIYRARKPVAVWGRVGLLIETIDRIDGSDRSVGPYRITLRIDGARVFEIRQDRACYEEGWFIDHLFDRGAKLVGDGTFYRLFNQFGQNTSTIAFDTTDRLSFADGREHEAVIEVADAADHTAEARLTLVADRPPRVSDVIAEQTGGRLIIHAAVEDPDGTVPEVTGEILTAYRSVLARFPLDRVSGGFQATVDTPGAAARIVRIVARDPGGLSDRVQRWVGADASETSEVRWSIREGDGVLDVDLRLPPATRRPAVLLAYVSPLGSPSDGLPVRRDLRAVGNRGRLRGTVLLPADQDLRVRLQAVLERGDDRFVAGTRDLVLRRATGGARIASDDGLAAVEFPAGSVYAPFPIQVLSEPSPPRRWVRAVGQAYRFTRPDVPFREKIAVRLKWPPGEDPSQLGIYLLDRGEAWYMGGKRAASGDALEVETAHLGTFALYRDDSAPWIGANGPADGAATTNRRPRIWVSCGDVGSGLFEGGIALSLDGVRTVPQWHPQRYLVIYDPATDLAIGRHVVEFSATDRAGNVLTRSFRFDVK